MKTNPDDCCDNDEPLAKGDLVRKRSGYKYPGVIVSRFRNTYGDLRFVVECTAAVWEKMLHIFNEQQLERRQEPEVEPPTNEGHEE